MNSWKMVKLSDAFDLQMGRTPSRNEPRYWVRGIYPWVSIADLTSCDKYISRTKEKLNEDAVAESGIKPVPAGTVIMSFKLSIGKTAITDCDVYTNEAIMAFLDKKTYSIDPNYIYHLFIGMDWGKGSNKAVMGITLNKATLSEIIIPLPPLEEQKKIAATLDAVSELIRLRKRQLEELDLLVKARFVEMFGDPVENEKGWKEQSIESISKKIGSGATPRGGQESYVEDGISLIRSMNVYNGVFKYRDLAHITEKQASQLDNVTVQSEDILLNITGASVARCCIAPDDVLPARVNQHVSIIRCKSSIAAPIFMIHVLISDSYQRRLHAIGEAGGATRQAITKKQIEELTVITPPIELQHRFIGFVNQIEKLKVGIHNGHRMLGQLSNSLMQKYFG